MTAPEGRYRFRRLPPGASIEEIARAYADLALALSDRLPLIDSAVASIEQAILESVARSAKSDEKSAQALSDVKRLAEQVMHAAADAHDAAREVKSAIMSLMAQSIALRDSQRTAIREISESIPDKDEIAEEVRDVITQNFKAPAMPSERVRAVVEKTLVEREVRQEAENFAAIKRTAREILLEVIKKAAPVVLGAGGYSLIHWLLTQRP